MTTARTEATQPTRATQVADAYYEFGTPAERWDRARMFFEAKEYVTAADILAGLVAEVPEQVAARLLLARAYYHSAQLRKAEAQLRAVLERDPVEQYAALMLGRTLERQGRPAEAAPHLRVAAALAGEFPDAEQDR
ncbi:tetratricopeptide repeat protein [Streptomyces sp. NPDC048111]|uniref:tetratricopeptide repeat protein n=1 Tax=Streptomyces sp. NPDC048111 TaxID=3365500 RepID=UPI00371493D2